MSATEPARPATLSAEQGARVAREPYYRDDSVTLWHGDSLAVLRDMPDASVNSCVTSPPYFGLRDYGSEGQYGLESSPVEYVETMRAVFAEVRRVLVDDGTLWLNLGDSYSGVRGGEKAQPQTMHAHDAADTPSAFRGKGSGRKNLLGIPWRVAFALQDDGWILRNDIIWAKPNAMPESVTDRLSNRHEHVFMFSKSRRYWFDLDPVREPHITAGRDYAVRDYSQQHGSWAAGSGGNHRNSGRDGVGASEFGRNPGDIWEIPTTPFSEAHFAVFPPALAHRCVVAGCKPGGTVLDPFSGSGTTGMVATKAGRRYVGIDLSCDYLDLSLRTRLAQGALIETDGGAA